MKKNILKPTNTEEFVELAFFCAGRVKVKNDATISKAFLKGSEASKNFGRFYLDAYGLCPSVEEAVSMMIFCGLARTDAYGNIETTDALLWQKERHAPTLKALKKDQMSALKTVAQEIVKLSLWKYSGKIPEEDGLYEVVLKTDKDKSPMIVSLSHEIKALLSLQNLEAFHVKGEFDWDKSERRADKYAKSLKTGKGRKRVVSTIGSDAHLAPKDFLWGRQIFPSSYCGSI